MTALNSNENSSISVGLEEFADINGHLDFIEKVLDSYDWQRQEMQILEEQLIKIKNKQADKLLNLTVVGEFSTGKSTFINALLRCELLSSCALQGTTLANTVIEYSDEYAINLIYKNGEKRRSEYASLQEISGKIDGYTTESELAQQTDSVEIYLPAQNIREKFRIIDTPGTNALEAWHEQVTKTALREISDASVILVDSTKPFSESLCDFVMSNLEGVLPQCVFVMTKFDMIPKREQKMMLAYAKQKVKSTFGISDAVILPYSSLAVLQGDEDNEFYKLSLESEAKLMAHMAKQRTVSQIKKIISFTDLLYSSATVYIQRLSKKYEDNLQMLLKSQREDFSVFIEKQKHNRTRTFASESGAKIRRIISDICVNHENAIRKIRVKVFELDSVEALEKYVRTQLHLDCNAFAESSVRYANSEIVKISRDMEWQITYFQDDFSTLFKELRLLEIEFTSITNSLPKKICVYEGAWSDIIDYVGKKKTEENRSVGGGLAAGAAIGTAIFPVVGTVIGGVAGVFGAKSLFSPKVDAVRNEIAPRLNMSLYNFFNGVAMSIEDELIRYVNSAVNNLRTEIDRYYAEYKGAVENQIRKEKLKRKAIEARIEAINADLNAIEQRKIALDTVEKQLDSMNGEE